MGSIPATTPIPSTPIAANRPADRAARPAARAPAGLLGVLGALGLLGILATVFLVSAGAASGPSQYVPARSGGWPALARGSAAGPGHRAQQRRLPDADAAHVRELSARADGGARDCRSRRSPARSCWPTRSCCSGRRCSPRTSSATWRSRDWARCTAWTPTRTSPPKRPPTPAYHFIGWPFLQLPLRPAVHAAELRDRAARAGGRAVGVQGAGGRLEPRRGRARWRARPARLGHSPGWAAAFVGLNPVLLVLAVGGAHNDTLLAARARGRARAERGHDGPHARGPLSATAALAAGVGVKVTAGLVLPFLVLAAPRRAASAGGWRSARARPCWGSRSWG